MKKYFWLITLQAALLAGVLNVTSATAQVSGVSFSFSPAVEYILFEDNAALKPGYAFGGSLGLGFGQYIELHAAYALGESHRTDFSRLSSGDLLLQRRLDALENHSINMQRFGLTTKVNLSSTAVVPYLTAGTGVVRFTRSGLKASDSVFLTGGGGFMFSVANRYTLFAQATHTGYRYNPGSAFLRGTDLIVGGLDSNNFSQQLVSNWHFGAGLKVYLGGRTYESDDRSVLFLDEFNGGLRNLRWAFDAVYGQVFFNNENIGFPSPLSLTGLQFGADFGPFIGLRGFYWHGVDADGGLRFDNINAYGGELRATFFQTSVSPTLTLGGGYLNVHSNYRSGTLAQPKSQPFATTGAGIEVEFTEQVSFTGDIRAFILTQDGVDNQISPSKLELSPMFTLGVSYRIGQFRYRERRQAPSRREPVRTSRRFDDGQTEAQQQLLVMREAALSAEVARAMAQGDTLTARTLQLQLDQVRESSLRLAGAPAHQTVRTPDNRMISLPVLEEGEVYIRFGPPAPVAAAPAPAPPTDPAIRELERRIEQLTREQTQPRDPEQRVTPLPTPPPAEATPAATPREQALERRIAELELRLTQAAAPSDTSDVTRRIPTLQPLPDEEAAVRPGELQGVAVHLGLANPFQATFGVRGDYGSLFGDRVELIPEFIIGLGGSTRMYNINAITLIPLSRLPYINISPFSPYAGFGIGLKAFSNPPANASGIQFVWSAHFGATTDLGPGQLFIEYTSQNLFSYNNLAAGYRFRF
ncbi:hypothetical protein CYPRO_0293 [Cyclonatronum proteinivorum]|uniref:Outer membrane protein beta-barrel domain-containing protein n=1 Tax=Cyclonatronum proteinivorum TaxID=1457365 RepID=A0A345UGH9_9BACT|nr:hypothetical protein [Cyclonatronum proteinivorum]AXI99580.1 hypothetical protein CYPRO_0293 [Cyclonatronum proteinivorum]